MIALEASDGVCSSVAELVAHYFASLEAPIKSHVSLRDRGRNRFLDDGSGRRA